MKPSVRAAMIAFVAASTGMFSFAAPRVLANPPDTDEIMLNKEAVQILKGSSSGNDTLNLKITFTNLGDPGCDAEDSDIIGHGIQLRMARTDCEDLDSPDLEFFDYSISSFVPKTVGGVKIGTYFAVNGLGSVTAKATTQTTSACGKWILELQATKLNLSSITQNPIALRLADKDGDTTCFDINNALIGTGF